MAYDDFFNPGLQDPRNAIDSYGNESIAYSPANVAAPVQQSADYGRYGVSSTVQDAGQRSQPQSMYNPWGTPTTKRTSSLNYTGSAGGGGAGGGGFNYKQPVGMTQTTTRTATKALPTLGPAPTFALPPRDEARRRRLVQEAAAPGLRSQRRQTRLALMRQHYDDPRARENIRAILGGHGDALSRIMGEAGARGRQDYQAERAEDIMTAQTNYQAAVARWKGQFEAAMQDYLSSFTDTTTRKNEYGSGAGGSEPALNRFHFGGYARSSGVSVPKVWG